MSRYGEQVLDRLERFVSDVEAGTSAELVLVLAHQAERYPDVPFKVGSLAGLAALVALVFLPLDFMAELLLLDFALAFCLGFAAGRFSPRLTRLLTTARRRAAGVGRAARSSFVERGVSLTRERTGVLVFISWLERRVELLVDIGVEKRIPLDELNAARRRFETADLFADFPDRLPGAFAPINELLERYLPCGDDNPDEIPNRPVVIR